MGGWKRFLEKMENETKYLKSLLLYRGVCNFGKSNDHDCDNDDEKGWLRISARKQDWMKNSRDDKTFSISPPKLITGFDHLCIPSTSSSSYNRNFVVDDSNDHQVSGWQLYNPGLWCIGKSIFWYIICIWLPTPNKNDAFFLIWSRFRRRCQRWT